jgi:alpha-galactosidase
MAHTLLDEFLAVRHCFYGDYYPLTPYSLAPEAWIAWQFDRPDLGEGLVQAFRRPESDVLTVQHRLRGLVPDARYELSSVDLPETTTMTGRELMEEGLPVTITDRPEAVVISYRIVA